MLDVRTALREDALHLDICFVELNNIKVAERVVAVSVQEWEGKFT